MSNTHADAMGPKFIKLMNLINEKGDTAPVIVPISFIKNVSRVERSSEIIAMPTPEIGKCAISLLDGGMLVVDHSFEEMAEVLNALDAPKMIALMAEKNAAGVVQ